MLNEGFFGLTYPPPLTTTPQPPVEMITDWVNTSLYKIKLKKEKEKNLTDNPQIIKIENYKEGPACVHAEHTITHKGMFTFP